MKYKSVTLLLSLLAVTQLFGETEKPKKEPAVDPFVNAILNRCSKIDWIRKINQTGKNSSPTNHGSLITVFLLARRSVSTNGR
jgi:hypothetical protein